MALTTENRPGPDAGDPPAVVGPPPGHRDAAPPSTPLWIGARVLLVAALVCGSLALLAALRPVQNPGVQDCGAPAAFLFFGQPNVIVYPGQTGTAEEAQRARQPTCRTRAEDGMALAGRLFGAFVATAALGALFGLVDDRIRYRRAPRFASLLRELPEDEQVRRGIVPRVAVEDLGDHLPPLERPELAGLVVAGLVAAVALPAAAQVGDGGPVPGVAWGPIVLAAGAVAVSVAAAAALRRRALAAGEDGPDSWGRALAVAVGTFWWGGLRPYVGAFGVDLHRLRKAGRRRRPTVLAVAVAESVTVVVHLLLALLTALLLRGDGVERPALEEPQLILSGAVVLLIVSGASAGRRRWRALTVRPTGAALRRIARVAPSPGDRAELAGAALALTLARSVALALCLVAFGAPAPLTPVLAVTLVIPVAMALSPTPGGSGTVEAVIMLLLMLLAGTAPGPAAGAALAFRALTFWLPLVPGVVVARRLAADRVV
jgi:uncharacterized membrane protein YbhN (UPF0104 family)